MRVLITGANSLLGKALFETQPKKTDLILTDLPKKIKFKFEQNNKEFTSTSLDVTLNSMTIKRLKQFNPNVVIHLASVSSVDHCQTDPQLAKSVNIKGTNNILGAAQKVGAKVIFTSSNGVFGNNNAPFSERQKPKPIHTYGKTKLRAEHLVLNYKNPWLITRLITMYGWQPPGARLNPVTWTLKKLKKGQTLNMVTDNYTNPLYAPSAANAIWKLIKSKKTGIFHIAGKNRVNRYQWAKKIAHTFAYKQAKINPVTSDFFPDLAPRPRNTSLSTSKIQRQIPWKPLTLTQGLKEMKKNKT